MKNTAAIFLLALSFNLYAQEWQVVEGDGMLHPVYGGEAVVVDSLIYIIGGHSGILNSNVNLIQEYNPQSNVWRIVDSMNALRYGFIAGNYQDSIVIFGGVGLDLINSLETWNLNNPPYIYDSSSGFTRTFATGLIRDDILYVFGGELNNLLSTYMFEYNIPAKTIQFGNNFDFMTVYPYQQTSALAGERIYLFGGVFLGSSRRIYSYDTQNRELDSLQTRLSQARVGSRAVSFSDSMIYIIGGLNENNPALSTVEIFYVDSGNYNLTSGPELNFGRSELMAVKYNNTIYVFGGKNEAGSPVPQVEKLGDTATDIQNADIPEAKDFRLFSNYPNPFNPSTLIGFYLPSRSLVQIKIYDITGKEISELINDVMEKGNHEVIFNTSEGGISQLSSGVYFYRLTAFNFSTQKTYIATRKMILLK